jgi:uncharacterized protein (DUF3084 family)
MEKRISEWVSEVKARVKKIKIEVENLRKENSALKDKKKPLLKEMQSMKTRYGIKRLDAIKEKIGLQMEEINRQLEFIQKRDEEKHELQIWRDKKSFEFFKSCVRLNDDLIELRNKLAAAKQSNTKEVKTIEDTEEYIDLFLQINGAESRLNLLNHEYESYSTKLEACYKVLSSLSSNED